MLHIEGVYTLDHLKKLKREDIRMIRQRSHNVQTMQLRLFQDAWTDFHQRHLNQGKTLYFEDNDQFAIINVCLLKHSSSNEPLMLHKMMKIHCFPHVIFSGDSWLYLFIL